MKEKPNLITQLIITVIVAVLIAALFFAVGRFSNEVNYPEKQDSSNPLIIKDVTETIRWKVSRDSAYNALIAYKKYSDRKISSYIKIIKQNEANKKIFLSVSDSTAIRINDSLRSRYSALFIQGSDEH